MTQRGNKLQNTQRKRERERLRSIEKSARHKQHSKQIREEIYISLLRNTEISHVLSGDARQRACKIDGEIKIPIFA